MQTNLFGEDVWKNYLYGNGMNCMHCRLIPATIECEKCKTGYCSDACKSNASMKHKNYCGKTLFGKITQLFKDFKQNSNDEKFIDLRSNVINNEPIYKTHILEHEKSMSEIFCLACGCGSYLDGEQAQCYYMEGTFLGVNYICFRGYNCRKNEIHQVCGIIHPNNICPVTIKEFLLVMTRLHYYKVPRDIWKIIYHFITL